MSFRVSIKRQKIFVNGQATKKLDESSGGFRLIAETEDGYIVKADCQDGGGGEKLSLQTYSELCMLPYIRDTDARYLPHVIAHGTLRYQGHKYCWLVEEKANLLKHPRVTASAARIVKRIIDRYGLTDINWPVIGSRLDGTANWGITKRTHQPVVYDFGCNMHGAS
jgi:hypothetical protein